MLYVIKGHENKEHLSYNFHVENISYKTLFIDSLEELQSLLRTGPIWNGKELVKTNFIIVLSSKLNLGNSEINLKSDRRNDFYLLIDGKKTKQYSKCLNSKAKEYKVIPNEVHLKILGNIQTVFNNKKDYEIFKDFFIDKPFLLSQYLPYIQSIINNKSKLSTEFVYGICNYSTTKFYYPPKLGNKRWKDLAYLNKKDLWTLFIDRGERCSILHNYLTQNDRCLVLIQPLNILVDAVKDQTIIDLKSAAVVFERWASKLSINKSRYSWSIDLTYEQITQLEKELT